MKRHRHDDSRNKKIDDRLIRKGASHKNLAAVWPIPRHHASAWPATNWQSLTIKK